MRIKSYLAKTVDDAIAQARQELGTDALLLNTRRVPGQGGLPSRYEVMFGCVEEQPAVEVEEFRPVPIDPPKRFVKPAPIPVQAHVEEAPAMEVEEFRPAPVEPPKRFVKPAPKPAPPVASAGLEKLQAQMDELRALVLRSSYERTGIGRTVPELVDVYAKLRASEVDAALAKDIVDRLEALMDTDAFFMKSEADAPRWKALRFDARRLHDFVRAEMLNRVSLDGELGNVVALVGPTGVGKTTTLKKIASAQTMPVRTLPMVTSSEIIAEVRKKAMVLIDTPGYLPEAGPAAELLASSDIEVHLVVPGYMRAADLRRCIDKYSIFNPTRLLVTKLDETETLGAAFSEAARTGLSLSFLTNGPSHTGQIRAASVEDLVALALDREQAHAVCA